MHAMKMVMPMASRSPNNWPATTEPPIMTSTPTSDTRLAMSVCLRNGSRRTSQASAAAMKGDMA